MQMVMAEHRWAEGGELLTATYRALTDQGEFFVSGCCPETPAQCLW
jgi:hypothetical protein